MKKNLFLALAVVMLLMLPCAAQELNEKLCMACFCGDVPRAQRLLNEGAKINATDKNGWTPLVWAVTQNCPAMVTFLLDNHADINSRVHGATPLIWASIKENAKMVEILLKYRPHVNARDSFGNTALDYAVVGNNDEVIKLLIDGGAHITPHVLIGTPKDKLRKLFEIKMQHRVKVRLEKELRQATEAGRGYTSR